MSDTPKNNEASGLPTRVPAGVDPRISHSLEKLNGLFIAGEKLEALSVQIKFMCYLGGRRRSIVAVTNNRLMFINRPLFGGFKLTDFQWRDITSAHVGENILPSIFGSKLSVSGQGQRIEMNYLGSDDASKIYRLCQQQEQAWREKNRIRQMEEERAKAGGIVLGGSPRDGFGKSGGSGNHDDAMTKLEKAKSLHLSGVISDTEFETLKAKILSDL